MASLEKKAAACYNTLYRSLQTNCEPYEAGEREGGLLTMHSTLCIFPDARVTRRTKPGETSTAELKKRKQSNLKMVEGLPESYHGG